MKIAGNWLVDHKTFFFIILVNLVIAFSWALAYLINYIVYDWVVASFDSYLEQILMGVLPFIFLIGLGIILGYILYKKKINDPFASAFI